MKIVIKKDKNVLSNDEKRIGPVADFFISAWHNLLIFIELNTCLVFSIANSKPGTT